MSVGSKCDSGSSYIKCPTCGGDGEPICMWCGGDGESVCVMCGGDGQYYDFFQGRYVTCEHCNGTGRLICSHCNGTGKLKCSYCGGDGKIKVE